MEGVQLRHAEARSKADFQHDLLKQKHEVRPPRSMCHTSTAHQGYCKTTPYIIWNVSLSCGLWVSQEYLIFIVAFSVLQAVKSELKKVKAKLEIRDDYFSNFTTQLFRCDSILTGKPHIHPPWPVLMFNVSFHMPHWLVLEPLNLHLLILNSYP